MRRAPFLAALALPAIAIAAMSAQSGQVIEVNNFDVATGASYINAAHCAGTDKLNLEWNIVPLNGQFNGTGNFRIFASNTDPATRTGDNANFCHEADDTNASPQVFAGQVDTFSADTLVQDAEVAGSVVAAKANVACDGTGEGKVVFVCSHWYPDTTRNGRASGKFVVQVKAPAAPAIRSVDSRDSALEVSWDPGEGGDVEADSYVASATTVVGGPVVASATTDAEEVTIGGLTNFTTYFVHVQAVSIGGNLSEASDDLPGTPSPSAGFFELYKDRGGVEQGGCATGSAGALALLATASLLAIRRRKP